MKQYDEYNWEVLLAEDDKDDAMIFGMAVTEAGLLVRLRHAVNGDELFVLLKEAIPDIIFLDIHMPCKDGIACIREIRKNPAYDKVPVIMYTSSNAPEKIDNSFRAGANFYLYKSNSLSEIAQSLRKVFSVEWKKKMYYPPKDDFTIGSY